MGVPRPGGNGARKSKLFDDYHQVMVKLPTELYRRFRRKSEDEGSSPSARARELITEYMNGSGPEYHETKGDESELVLVERDQIRVLAGVGPNGEVMTDHVRIYDMKEQKEVVYWDATEWREGSDAEDPGTAMNAILSAIQLVASGVYRRVMEARRAAMLSTATYVGPAEKKP